MASTILLPQATYPIGTRTVGPANVPTNATKVEMALDGAAMTDPALHVSMTLDLSLDGGATWNSPHPQVDPFPIGMTLDGGATNRQGGPLATYTLGTQLPDPTNANRKIRMTVTIAGLPLTTQGTVTIT